MMCVVMYAHAHEPWLKHHGHNQAGQKDEGLVNLMRVSEQMFLGSEPHGDEGFKSLHRLGVKTVVSVDGVSPNIESATKR